MDMFTRVVVECPASTANLGPGFDVFGLALDLAYDRVEVEIVNVNGRGEIVDFKVEGPYAKQVPSGSDNVVYKLAKYILEKFNKNVDIRVRLWKNVKPRAGLGSSGASCAAITLALSTLLGLNLDPLELIQLAAEGERIVTGSAHADNVAPSLLGGFVVIRSYNPLDLVRLDPPEDLGIMIAIPEVETPEAKTKIAREVLPRQVELEKVVNNVGNACFVTLGFALKNVKLIIRGAKHDLIVEPARAQLVPCFQKLKQVLDRPNVAVTISGAGPSILILYDKRELGQEQVEELKSAIGQVFAEEGINVTVHVTSSSRGPRLVELC